MGELFVCLLFGLILFGDLSSGISAQVNLSIYPQPVKEYTSQKLTCTYLGAGIATVTWLLGTQAIGIINIANNECQNFKPPNSTLYNYTCSAGTNTFTLTILNVTRSNKGHMWFCSIFADDSTIQSQPITPDIIVPITSVMMTQPLTVVVTVQVNTAAVFVCETSGGLPAAQVTWFKDSGTVDNTADDINITVWSTYSTSNTNDNLIKVTSRLTFSPQKSDRNMRIYCSANNGGSGALVAFKKPLLNVHYPPESSPFIQQGFTFKVIESTQAMLSCSITGGNPLANLTWNCYNGIFTNRTAGETVTKEVSWIASRGQDGSCTCVSTHYDWMQSVSTSVEILFAPSTPTFSIGASPVNDTITVIENKTLLINCNSNSKPPPTYTWWYKDTTTSGYQLTIPNIQKSDNGLCTCEAKNTMEPSVGTSVTEKQTSSITVQVLYAPVVHSLASEDIVEGQTLTKVCEVTPGNPSTTTFTWTKVTDIRTWQTQTLSISNVSRSDASNYTCTAKNTMSPTVESVVIGEDSKSFFLNVLYSSAITLFTLNGVRESSIVSENDMGVLVICDVDSNPGSVITIQHDGTTLLIQNDAKHLKYSLERAQCTDAGYYRCIGRNAYNSQPAVEEIRLFVKCSPRPSPYVPLIDRLRTGLHSSTTLEFSALSYPEPTAFKWFKVTDSALLPIENANNTLITSEAVNTSLTIVNVTDNLFGKYLLTVHNERGVWNQSYYIEIYDFPFPPTNFKLSIIHGVSVLSWESSFNGGYEQSFLIQTSQEGTDIWSNLTLIHESDEAYKISTGHYVDVVTDLPSSVYRCRLIAVNSRGNAEAVYLTRPIRINRPYPDGTVGDNSALITGIVLGIFVIVLVVCVILLVVKLRRTSNIKGEYMSGKTTSRMKLPVYVNTEFNDEPKEHGARQARNMRGIAAIHGDGTSQRDGEYSSLDQRLRDNSATYDVISSRQITFT